MLNLTQRLTVGFTLLVALSLTLAIWVHRVLVPSGEAGGHAPVILWLLSGSAILVATLTLIYVLRPIQQLGRDIRRIASGDLTHRTEWGSAVRSNDSFGQKSPAKSTALPSVSGSCARQRQAVDRWSSNSPTPFSNRSSNPSS